MILKIAENVKSSKFVHIGFYCIDNMPLTLLPEFARQLEETSKVKRAAVSIDSRNLDFLNILHLHPQWVPGDDRDVSLRSQHAIQSR